MDNTISDKCHISSIDEYKNYPNEKLIELCFIKDCEIKNLDELNKSLRKEIDLLLKILY